MRPAVSPRAPLSPRRPPEQAPGLRRRPRALARLADHAFLGGSVIVALYAVAVEALLGGERPPFLDFAFQNGWIGLSSVVILVAFSLWFWRVSRKTQRVAPKIVFALGVLFLLFFALLWVGWVTSTTFWMLGIAYFALVVDYVISAYSPSGPPTT